MANAAVDNDILIKLCAYGLLNDCVGMLGGVDQVGVLGQARYVVPAALARDSRFANRQAAIAAWRAVEDALQALEPSADELRLAVEVEEQAARSGLPLDPGESQLMAIAILRPVPVLATGDKRAIAAAQRLRQEMAELTSLDGRVLCLEQIIERLIELLGIAEVRSAVCAEPKADRAISICMACASSPGVAAFSTDGLSSYIADVRRHAPTLLRDY